MADRPETPIIQHRTRPPAILAPAGGRAAFLAAIAAGADAVYAGLKTFSARMAAENFTIAELAQLTGLAHEQGVSVHVALNSLVTPDELNSAGTLIEQLARRVKPDALIIQDPAMLTLARQAEFSGEIHLSTLANISFPGALKLVGRFPEVKRVVLPRELSIDEIKQMAEQCPNGLSLEVFVHGALCYGISGRCYWSSFLGGKSGLRGRCVQPCRRAYEQGGRTARYFSCQDLGFDVLTKLLVNIPQVSALKIEGRKKGPHYVYYTVLAYRLLRDHAGDPGMKKQALSFLEYALGRPGTHYRILSQRPQNPVDVSLQTGSGMLIGAVKGARSNPYLIPREALYAQDMLRIGYEDDPWHATWRVGKYVPSRGRLVLKPAGRLKPANGTPVFLIDRREKELAEQIDRLEKRLQKHPLPDAGGSAFTAVLPKKGKKTCPLSEITVARSGQRVKEPVGLWLSLSAPEIRIPNPGRFWSWLPPVIWPDDQEAWRISVQSAIRQGCKNFVLNAPWQIIFFGEKKRFNLWAGPFCNIANALSVGFLADLGFNGVIASPELGRRGYEALAAESPLPLGIVLSGNWPLCVSRTVSEALTPERLFTSPKGEQAWASRYGANVWVFPNWRIDLTGKRELLIKYGYRMFVHLAEPVPKEIFLKKRPGLWNWDIGLK